MHCHFCGQREEEKKSTLFCIDVTFEMRTVLSRNPFIQFISWKWLPEVLYQTKRRGREQYSRETACVRRTMLQQEKDSVSNKTDR